MPVALTHKQGLRVVDLDDFEASSVKHHQDLVSDIFTIVNEENDIDEETMLVMLFF